jgi:hypothetical protein
MKTSVLVWFARRRPSGSFPESARAAATAAPATDLAHEPAEFIAQAAPELGQNDDITVITLTRLTPQDAAGSQLATSVSFPSIA